MHGLVYQIQSLIRRTDTSGHGEKFHFVEGCELLVQNHEGIHERHWACYFLKKIPIAKGSGVVAWGSRPNTGQNWVLLPLNNGSPSMLTCSYIVAQSPNA